MLREFKCDQHVFVHLLRKNLLFDINCSSNVLNTQMRTFLANLFQNILCKSHARILILIFGVKLVIFPNIETFQILNLL